MGERIWKDEKTGEQEKRHFPGPLPLGWVSAGAMAQGKAIPESGYRLAVPGGGLIIPPTRTHHRPHWLQQGL